MTSAFYAVDPQFLDLTPVSQHTWPASNNTATPSPSHKVIWRIATTPQAPGEHHPTIFLPLERSVVLQGLATLFPQLSSTCTGPTPETLDACLANTHTFTLFLATDTTCLPVPSSETPKATASPFQITAVVGCLTLVTLRLLMNSRAHIEDLIVLDACRGQGLGRGLMRRALHEAFDVRGCKMCDLTSKPNRVEAWALYKSMGFWLRDTGAFRIYDPKLNITGPPSAAPSSSSHVVKAP
ncbi:hypothetical protein KVV02_007413 [Mortierella alpina]|uniref:N-acetyltransferase domain-containing protein n=1 Tax=Mortierella alpina TaxID=64518 RepID=A0A9P8A283_MORAP|nr:hypothetical protein KVV02_007413 [Mortierella alpina]